MDLTQFDNTQQGYDSYGEYLKYHKNRYKDKNYRSEYNS